MKLEKGPSPLVRRADFSATTRPAARRRAAIRNSDKAGRGGLIHVLSGTRGPEVRRQVSAAEPPASTLRENTRRARRPSCAARERLEK